MQQNISIQILSAIITFMKYSRFIHNKRRRETWEEIVTRNKRMHIKKFPRLKNEIETVYKFVYEKKVLPSMRSAQFAGKAVEINPCRVYNCSYTPMDHPDTFSELMFLLLSGCGVGYSVQYHHVNQLPEIIKPKKSRRFLVADSIEGWTDAVKVLIKAYMGSRASLPNFDFSDIRPKGTPLLTSGGVAPGPEPLMTCLHHIQMILDRKKEGEKLTPLEVHDINCFLADAVLAGGVRRASMIALFSYDDNEMLSCKFGNWEDLNPQRARANNSVVLLRHRIKKEEFLEIWDKIEKGNRGEPGIYFTNDKDIGLNPCGEISLISNQFCNLVTANVSDVEDQKDLNNRVRAAAFIATLQASYTDFHYLRDIWRSTTEKDALIGVGMSGIASGKVLELDMKEAAKIVLEENERISKLIGINSAARCTTVKPDGTSSLVLGCSSGIHAWHNDYYIRRIRVGKEEAIYAYLKENYPNLVEDDYFKPHIQAVVSIPVKAPEGAITRSETALQLLKRLKKVYTNWIRPGHRRGSNHNNVSCTVSIKPHEWERVGEWLWENRDYYTAISVLPYDNSSYVQAPLEDIDEKTYNKLVKTLKKIDLTKVKENRDVTSLNDSIACGGGSCELV